MRAERMENTRMQKIFCAWRRVGLLALLGLLACARCASLKDEDTESDDSVLYNPLWDIQLNRSTREIHVYVWRCPDKAEARKMATTPVELYRETLATEMGDFEKTALHTVRFVRARLGQDPCAGTCCADIVLCMLAAMARMETLGISTLSVRGFVSAGMGVLQLPLPLSLQEVFALPLTVHACELRSVSSYLFHGVSKMLRVVRPAEPGQALSAVAVADVPSVDFEHCPPAHSWNVAVLSFMDVGTLNLGYAVAERVLEARLEERPGVWVGESLTVSGAETRLAMQNVLLALPSQGVALEIMAETLALCVPAAQSSVELAAELHATVSCLVSLGARVPWVSLVVGEGYCVFSETFREGLQREIFWALEGEVARGRKAPLLAGVQEYLVDVRETRASAPFLYVQVENHRAPAGVAWAVQLPSVLLQSGDATAQAVRTLSEHASSAAAESAAGVLQSLLAGGENSALLASVPEPWPEKMTLLPCGCFAEDAWNTAWHGAEWRDTYEPHAATHRDHYPVLALQRGGELARAASVLRWKIALQGEEALACSTGYTVEAGRLCLAIEVVPVHARLQSPACAHHVWGVEQHFAPAVQSLVQCAEEDVYFDTVSIACARGVSLSLYRYLCVRFVDALARCGMRARSLEVHHGAQGCSSAPLTPYMRAALAQLRRTRWESARVCVQHLGASMEYLEDLGWLAGVVSVGTPVSPGTLDVVLESPVSLHVWPGPKGAAEVHLPEIEQLMSTGRWHVGVVAVCAPHALVLHKDFPLAFSALSLHARARVIVSGVPVFGTLAAVAEYFEWRRASAGQSMDLAQGEDAAGVSGLTYCPVESEVCVADPEISAQCSGSLARVRKYVEAVAEEGPKVTSITCCVEELGKALASAAHGHTFCPATMRTSWACSVSETLKVFLQKRSSNTVRQVCLPCLPSYSR